MAEGKERAQERHYSYMAQLQERLDNEASARMAKVSPAALKAVIAHVESRQLEVALSAVTEDDPVQNAKLRGMNIALQGVAEEMFSRLMPSSKPEKEEEPEHE